MVLQGAESGNLRGQLRHFQGELLLIGRKYILANGLFVQFNTVCQSEYNLLQS
jgi:hypothetical protein